MLEDCMTAQASLTFGSSNRLLLLLLLLSYYPFCLLLYNPICNNCQVLAACSLTLVTFIHMKPAAFRRRTSGRPNSRSLPFQVTGNVQGNAIGKIWTPLSFHKFYDQILGVCVGTSPAFVPSHLIPGPSSR